MSPSLFERSPEAAHKIVRFENRLREIDERLGVVEADAA